MSELSDIAHASPDPTLITLIRAAVDGSLTPDQRHDLEHHLTTDRAARRLYQDHMFTDAALQWEFAVEDRIKGSAFRVQEEQAPTPTLSRRFGRRSVWYFSALAATIALAAALSMIFLHSPEPRTASPVPSNAVATVTNLDHAVFAPKPRAEAAEAPDSTLTDFLTLGSALQPGPIHLQSGKAQIMFASTAVVDLTGPCRFAMTGPNSGRLLAGSLSAYIPAAARGFTVDLPGGARVTDLGTAFHLTVDDHRRCLLSVDRGHVRISDARDHYSELIAGQRVCVVDGHVDAPADGLIPTIVVNNDSFEFPGVHAAAGAFLYLHPSNGPQGDWMFGPGANGIAAAANPPIGFGVRDAIGQQAAVIQGDDSVIYQDLTVGPDAVGVYTLSFAVEARRDGDGSAQHNPVKVLFGPVGGPLRDLGDYTADSADAFRTLATDPIAVSAPGRYRLQFQGTVHGDRSSFIDHVQFYYISPAATPSPQSDSSNNNRRTGVPSDGPSAH